jgi:hypothetical protein
VKLYLADEGGFISSLLWRISKYRTLKAFLERSHGCIPWTQEENEQLLPDWPTIGPRWTYPSRLSGERSETQLENRCFRCFGIASIGTLTTTANSVVFLTTAAEDYLFRNSSCLKVR